LGRQPLGAIHSSNEPGELSQWLCHDDSTIEIVVIIIIIIIISGPAFSSAPVGFDHEISHTAVGQARYS